MPLVATRGAASAQGFGEFAQSAAPVYIEDVMSVYLYTGNGSTQTITNGIDLSTYGGLVWLKGRDVVSNNSFVDTARGTGSYVYSNSSAAADTGVTTYLTAFNSNGFALGSGSGVNQSSKLWTSWTFRKQPKFFDVVTFTQSGTSGYQTINHNLGSVPGVIIIKGVGQADGWFVYHRSIPTQVTYLNQTNAAANFTLSNSVTSTTFNFNLTDFGFGNGATYVAYLFAHDAGGFGLTGSDNVISCGSFTTNASGIATVTLGYEPQWVLIKRTDSTSEWHLLDTMRGFSQSTDAWLRANSSAAEDSTYSIATPNATGFTTDGTNIIDPSSTFIYIAIRRGPMKTPTTGTSVFSPNTTSNDSAATTINFPLDMLIEFVRAGNANNSLMTARLVGNGLSNRTALTNGDFNSGTRFTNSSTAVTPDVYGSGVNVGLLSFRRAPGFFDVVCYTGTGSATTFSHNLGVVPEMMIVKRRSTADNWFVYSQTLGNTKHIALDGSGGASGNNIAYWNNTSPTASVFSVGNDSAVNASASTYVNYLFASCPGVSKVGSYTGTGTTLQIDCGFTGGARFVLIKRTDSTGDWYVWDSARGIVAGNDPYLLLNSTAAEVTNTDYVDTYSAGFEISSTAPAAINANGGTFIFLAIA